MDWQDEYKSGHLGDLSGYNTPIPPWLASLGWSGAGLWVDISKEDLDRAIPGLIISPPLTTIFRFTIVEPPDDQGALRYDLIKLDDSDFPLIASMGNLEITCSRYVLSKGISGSVDLVGNFILSSQADKAASKMTFKLPRRLVLAHPPCDVTIRLGETSGVDFKVKCTISCNYLTTMAADPVLRAWLREHTEDTSPALPVSAKPPRASFSFFEKIKRTTHT